MNIVLHIWRQKDLNSEGQLKEYKINKISEDMSLLEVLDQLNEQLIKSGDEPVVFDHDCREGICGQCGIIINGEAHGPHNNMSTCQIHMRSFKDGEHLYLEPFRSKAFPVRRDLSVVRSNLDKIIASGGYISVSTGQAPESNAIPVSKESYDLAMDAAACIGCGACVAACPNASAALFTGAKISHLSRLPQGQPELAKRVQNMVQTMDEAGFGNCSNHATCEAVCPAGISIKEIAVMNHLYIKTAME